MRESAGNPLEVGENPIAPLIMQAVEGGREEPAVIHRKTWNASRGWSGSGLFRAFPGSMSSRNWPSNDQMSEGSGRFKLRTKT
jgi:hypothetical protein